MSSENKIAIALKELENFSEIKSEYSDLYSCIENANLKEALMTLHCCFIELFNTMNIRLPTDFCEQHYWADESRKLIKTIEVTLDLYHGLKGTKYEFDIDSKYLEIMDKCREFLKKSGGSSIPVGMKKIDLYYKIPIFTPVDSVTIDRGKEKFNFALKLIGSGSYANVYEFTDSFYDKTFVIKRARKDLSNDELGRFKREFETTKSLSSPYIVEVYSFDSNKNEYIMEKLDTTLNDYIKTNNNKLNKSDRVNLILQIIRAFEYIHNKDILHRDISPRNILLKLYEETKVIKVSDFGLVKIPNSSLTRDDTVAKGSYNDPLLSQDGFNNYSIEHEIYAITRIIHFIMTGRDNLQKINDNKFYNFIKIGINLDKNQRYKSVSDLKESFQKYVESV